MNYKRSMSLLLVAMLAISTFASPAMAANDFNADATAAQNPFISSDVTISNYDVSEMSPGDYEDDSGSIATLPAVVNKSDSVDDIGSGYVNPHKFIASDIDFSDASAFPHAKTGVSAVDNESEWSVDNSGTAGSMTVSDSSTAPGVEALEVSTSSQTSGDTAVATFSNVSITSDAEKRYIQVIADVSTLDSSADVEIKANDTDGDYVATRINSSASATDDDVMATGTGEGFVIQEQVGALTTQGSGDGTIAEIDSVEIVVNDADATIQISALNLDKTSEWSLGDKRVDTDSDDDFETETIRDVESAGQIGVHDISTLGSVFDNAEINDLEMPMHFRASDLENSESRINVSFSDAEDYPSFENKQTAYYRLRLPSAYDLSYANAELRQDITLPNTRYQSVELVEGASDTAFSDLSGWTDVTSSVGSLGDESVLDSTIQPGQEIAFQSITLVTDDEKNAVENLRGTGQFGESDEGFLDMILSPFGAVAGGLGVLWARIRGAV